MFAIPVRINLLEPKPRKKLRNVKIISCEGSGRRYPGDFNIEAFLKRLLSRKKRIGILSFDINEEISSSIRRHRLVNSKFRGKGIGSAMLARMEEILKAKGIKTARIETSSASTARLLLSNGYKIANREPQWNYVFSKRKNTDDSVVGIHKQTTVRIFPKLTFEKKLA